MQQKREIQDFLIQEFAFLEKEHGLSKPIIKNEEWSTDIYYLGSEMGFEFELDWHDFNIFVLIVLLEDGKIPGGYYMHNGKRYRIHLEKVLKENLQICDEAIDNLTSRNLRVNKYSKETMEDRIVKYGIVLKRHASKLIISKEAIFGIK